jgi:DNA-directed RNA polymerase specialized sigma24 family protein
MTIDTQTALSVHDARSTWENALPHAGIWMINAIRTMGMSNTSRVTAWPRNGDGGGYFPSTSAVRICLMNDLDLHEEVLASVEAQYWLAVGQGKIWRDHVRGWICRVTQRTTRRLATSRAKILLQTACPRSNDDELNMETPGDSLEELVAKRQLSERLARALDRLPDRDRELILQGKGEERYAELAAARNTTPGALRKRACILWERIRTEILSNTGNRDEPTTSL